MLGCFPAFYISVIGQKAISEISSSTQQEMPPIHLTKGVNSLLGVIGGLDGELIPDESCGAIRTM